MWNQEQGGNKLIDIFCYSILSILPFFLFSYRFLPKIKTVKILGYNWDFNGFSNSYSFLFAFLSKAVPILLMMIFILKPSPLILFKKKITFEKFLIPTLILFFYQMLFIIAPIDKIDEGFYTELTGWTIAFVMTILTLFSRQFFDFVNRVLLTVYLKILLKFNLEKRITKKLVNLIVDIKSNHYPKILARALYAEENENDLPSTETASSLAREFDKKVIKTFEKIEEK